MMTKREMTAKELWEANGRRPLVITDSFLNKIEDFKGLGSEEYEFFHAIKRFNDTGEAPAKIRPTDYCLYYLWLLECNGYRLNAAQNDEDASRC